MTEIAAPLPLGLMDRWRNELRGNRRAAAGLAAIFVLIGGAGWLQLRDASVQARADYRRELVRAERIDAIARERDWPQKAQSSAVLRAALEDRLWTAESDGLARADIQGWITGVAREIGLSTMEVRLDLTAPKGLPPNLRQITASITAQPTETALIALLRRIDAAPHLLVVQRLDVKQVPAPFLDMALTAYVRIGAKPAPQPATAGGGPL